MEPPNDDAGGEKNLVLAVALATGPVNIVDLEFWPKIFGHVILEGDIWSDRLADDVVMADGQSRAECPLNIYLSEALACGQSRRDYPGVVCECGAAGRCRNSKKRRYNLVAVGSIRAEQALLEEQERNIGKPVRRFDLSPLLIGWRIQNHFISGRGNKFEPLAAIEAVDPSPGRLMLPELVITHFFLQARCHRGEWCHPMRLTRLRGIDPLKPMDEVIAEPIIVNVQH